MIFLLLFLVLAGACLLMYYYLQMGNLFFLKETTINGMEFSEKNAMEVVDQLEKTYNNKEISVMEEGMEAFRSTLAEIGYEVDGVELLENVEECLNRQKKELIRNLLGQRDYTVEIPFEVNEEVFQSTIKAENLSTERIASENAKLTYTGESYEVTPEVYGNELDDAALQNLVREYLEGTSSDQWDTEDAQVVISEELYEKPTIFKEDKLLVDKMNAFNKYCNAQVTYQFGEQEQILDWDTIQNWILVNEGEGGISEEAVTDYVVSLEADYNTIYTQRTITTSHGYDVTLPSNDYGYRIDEAGEIAQLTADIASNTPVEREPIYEISGYQRNGRDDVDGTYVEIDLTAQHLWFYKDHALIVESDIVSGNPKYEQTTTGAFPLAYKASPFNLAGGGTDGVATWDVEVQYWMPFHDGQGLHDASWRGSSFGGNIFLTNGSHGCVNLPSSVAQQIYNNIEQGMPIFLYKTEEIPEQYLPKEENQ